MDSISFSYIFHIFRIMVILIVFIFSISAHANLDNFQKDLNYANSIRDTVQEEAAKFKPEETFKKDYTKNPDQMKYFDSVTQAGDKGLQKQATLNAPQDQTGSVVINASKTRPIFVIDSTSPAMQKSNIIQKDSYNISRGISDKYVDCKAAKECHTAYIKKSCNEEIRYLHKLCIKIPKVEIVAITYPNCRKMVRAQGWSDNPCPGGYTRSLYADMIDGPTWDDLFFCTKSAPSPTDSSDCYSDGYYIARTATKVMIGDEGMHSIQSFFGTGVATVPKHFHARIIVSNVYMQYMVGTIVNVTTGQTLYNQSYFTEGQIIELPFSDIQDQTFQFYATKQPNRRGTGNYGVMVLYIDHQGKQANITWETICHDTD